MMKDKEFIEELDEYAKPTLESFSSLINNSDINMIGWKILVDVPKDFIEKYSLVEDIQFVLEDNKLTYYYYGIKINPEAYYIRPDNYRNPSILEILQECIKQDTYKPDIKHLETQS